MVFNGHSSISKIILKRFFKYFFDLFNSFLVIRLTTRQMTIYNHDGLFINFKSDAHSSFITCPAQYSSFYFTKRERLFWYSFLQFFSEKNSNIAPYHAFICENQFFILYFLYRFVAYILFSINFIKDFHQQCSPALNSFFI